MVIFILESNNLKKGILFGSICIFLFSITPIIANSRPKVLDPYLFATTRSIIEVFLFFPIDNVMLLFDSINLLFIVLMGITYGLGLFCWYKLLSNMGTLKSSVMTSGDTIITTIFAIILLGELLTIYHVIGTVLVIISVIMIVKPRKEKIL